MQVKQQLELDTEQQTGSKLGKEYIKDVYHHPAYLAYMQSTSCKMLGWMKHKLESRLLRKISVTSDMQMTPHSSNEVPARLLKELGKHTWVPPTHTHTLTRTHRYLILTNVAPWTSEKGHSFH